MAQENIVVKGAREHNLKNIDLEIPRNRLVVITGLSGSGKSSLAFDTIYAEGQRRYVESLSAYARQFLEQMGKPDVDSIEGLSPAISIEQKTASKNPRSTVGTVTEIYDYLRLLFARVGHPHCYNCGKEITTQTVQQMVDKIMDLPEDTRIHVLAPVVRDRKGEYRKELHDLRKQGYVRVKVDGKVRDLSEEITMDKNKKHSIEVFVDRLVVKKNKIEKRLADSLETALKAAEGLVRIEVADSDKSFIFSERFACIDCGISYPEISPRMFSFNNPYGACQECGGLGNKMFLDPELIVPKPELTIREGAVAPWERHTSVFYYQMLEAVTSHYGQDTRTPFNKLSKKLQKALLYGSGDEEMEFRLESDGPVHTFSRPFEGVIPNLERRFRETTSDVVRDDIQRYMNIAPCPACQGKRLRKESLFIKIGGINIAEFTSLTIKKALGHVNTMKLSQREMHIASMILKEIRERLEFLTNVGLEYLTLDRTSATLSGGESQRIHLATQIGSRLMGVIYILDEPSIGLHQRDNKRLLETLTRLRDLGNTILVVEHDEETIRSADWVIDMGPGAGRTGGSIVAQGPPEVIINSADSLTGAYLSGRLAIPIPPRKTQTKKFITIKGAKANNLANINVSFPIGLFTAVTGVSGSGKSTLVVDTLYKAIAQKLYRSKERHGEMKEMVGLEHIDRVIDIDQSPIGRTPRSNPATYTGLFNHIRDLFAQLPESRMRGYKPGRYSFNVKGGRCEACQGEGLIKIEMHFLPDVFVMCDVCKGRRYNRETLEIRYKGKNIADVLDMTVNEALEFLENIPQARARLETLSDVGLGYIHLGQSATTLSGGEAQRIKLSRELSKRATGRTLYILDEPTTGLHFADIEKLLEVLLRLRDQGNTIVVIEHNLEVIKTADWIVDLGPEGGDLGGKIVAQGTAEEVAQNDKSYTGQFLKKILARNHRNKKSSAN